MENKKLFDELITEIQVITVDQQGKLMGGFSQNTAAYYTIDPIRPGTPQNEHCNGLACSGR